MRPKQSLLMRTDRLEQVHRQTATRLDAARLADELGIRTEELLAEAAGLAAWFQRVPAAAWRVLAVEIAEERGIDPAEVWTETERILGRGMG